MTSENIPVFDVELVFETWPGSLQHHTTFHSVTISTTVSLKKFCHDMLNTETPPYV